MVRFIHTSDWQLGMTRHFLEPEAQARYTAARIDAIRSIGALAREHGCEFVLVAGDVFDSNLVGAQTVRRALEAMAAIEVPVYLLPGNHDPLDAVTIYRGRLFARACPPNVHVLDRAGVVPVSEGVELVAAPWFGKAPLRDLVADALEGLSPPSAGVRVLVGHGALDALSPESDEPSLISLAGLERAVDDGLVQYAALGDKHTRLAVGRRRLVNYSGSPEVTSFREERPGDVLVVDVAAGAEPVVTPHHVGTWRFVTLEREISGDDDLDDLDEELSRMDPKDRTVVRTGLTGTLTLRQKARLDTLLDVYGEVLAACFTWPQRHDVAVILADDELTDLGVGGFVDAAVADLAGLSNGSGGPGRSGGSAAGGGSGGAQDRQAEIAREALSLLYRLAKGPAA